MSQLMQLAVVALVVLAVLFGLIELASWMPVLIRNRELRRRARIEAELDRTQAQLRATVLNLAAQFGADAHEARKALIRESFIAAQIERESPKR
jgi:hypothetical protein